MNKRLLILFIPLLIFSVALIPSIPRAHALIQGQVCVADPTTVNQASPCPAVAPIFNGPPPTVVTPPQVAPTQLEVGVYIQGSDALNGFGVTLLSDSSILKPAGADLTGTVLSRVGAPTVIAECFDGIAKVGRCDPTTDTLGTLHFAAAVLGAVTTPPTTGLLFTAIYNITGSAPAGGITIGYQVGCSGTSIADGTTCVTIPNGNPQPGAGVDPETVQGGSFDNSTPPPWISISSSATMIGPIIGGGVTGTATITATGQNGWPPVGGTNSMSFSTQQTAGLTVTPSATSCSPTGTPAACSITITVSGAAGNYAVTVFGSYSTIDATTTQTSTLVAQVTISVVVQDYSVSITGATVNIPPNGAVFGAATVTVTSLNGYSGSVTISTSAVAPTGLTVSYSPSTFTLAAGGSQASTVSFSSTTMNRYLLTVKAVSGALTHTTAPPLKVLVNSFTVTANPTTFSFNAGSTGSTVLTLQSYPVGNAVSGFAGTVTLTNSTALGLGPKAPCPATATLTAGASTTVTCNFSSLTGGTYSMTITGSGGSNGDVTNSTLPLSITVIPSFGLSASPTSLNANVTATGTSTITASDLGGFSGNVALSYMASPATGLTCAFSSASIAVPSGGSGTSTLSCTGTVSGTYTVTVTGTASGAATKTVNVVFTIQDFSIAAGASSPNPVLAGLPTTSTITVSPMNGFTGTISLSASPSGSATCTLSAPSVTLGSQQTAYLHCQASAAGDYTVTVTGTISLTGAGTLSHMTSIVSFTVETFTIAGSSPALVNVGSSASSTITVAGSGTGETVSLSVSASTGLTCTLSSPVSVPPTATPSLSCSATSAGTYTATVTGTVASESHSTATLTFQVADFSIAASAVTPTPISVSATGTSTITLTGINGFVDTVSLTSTISPGTGLTVSCSPTSISGSMTSTCTLTASASGSYSIDITGADGSLSHDVSFTATVAAPDFSLSASPTSVSFDTSGDATTTVTLTPLNGFTGTVSFGASVSPNLQPGLSVTCGPQTITAGTTTVCHFLSQEPGTYNVTITGTSANGPHSVNVQVTVTAPPSVNTIFGLPLPVFYGSLGGIILVAIVGSLVALRRRAAAKRAAAARKPPAFLGNSGKKR